MVSSMFSYDKPVIKTVLSSYNVLVNLLMGMTVAIPLLFAVVKDFNATSTPEDIIMLHILLCVPGYQLLMSQSFLTLCPYNTWSSELSRKHKRYAHSVIQLIGSTMAISGSIIIMIYKDVNFNTVHGKLGLTALIFTVVNLCTGVAAFFSKFLSKYIPRYVTTLTHIILGIVAFACASACLCYGFNKTSFRTWTNDSVTTGVIGFTGIFTLIILINPLITICKKIIHVVKGQNNNNNSNISYE